jgi:IS30 family transposase
MGKQYSQLDMDERIEIARLRREGKSFCEIGRLLGRHHTTIVREFGRNSLPKSGYKPALADHMAYCRCRRGSKLERLKPLQRHVRDRLACGWSPEQIAGRLRLRGARHKVSHETIYRFIYSRIGREMKLSRYLAHRKAKRGLRYFKASKPVIPNALAIANRPPAIEARQELGHWEGDLMQFRSQRGALLNLTERSTRLTLLSSLPSKKAEPTSRAVTDVLAALPKAARKSLTFDRGGEFADHQTMKRDLDADIWFCDPHSPWQRGTIENTNGILRRDMPRKSDITDYTDHDIQMIQTLLNSTPRKCLGYRTPTEAFIQKLNRALET